VVAGTEWPNRRAAYDRPDETAENTARWQQAVDDSLATGVLRWLKTSEPDQYNLAGACPRCAHETSQMVEVGWLRGFDAVQAEEVRLNFRCSCEMTHRGRKDDDLPAGCGWGGPLAITSTITAR
jgi:hypothetical protein